MASVAALAQESSGIGYPTVGAALEALKARSDVKISIQGGWTVVQEPSNGTLWSFTPPGHPAHPSAVKRTVVQRDGQVFIDMKALCQASKPACDELMAQFEKLNRQIAESTRATARSTPSSEIRVERLDGNSFRLTLKTFRSTRLEDGWAELLPKARALCGVKSVGYGHYQFEASDPISAAPPEKRFLLLKQEITCGTSTPLPPAVSTANKDTTWRPDVAQVRLIEDQTYAYFASKDDGNYEKAYSLFSPKQKEALPYETWMAAAAKFNANAGTVRSRRIKRITWYKDPPGTEPGVYAAVDFVSQFDNIDIHCGYVVWREQSNSLFMLVREEENLIDKQTQQTLKPEELSKARARIGC
jgi:Protein of unknown function (DUF4019)